MKRLLLGLILFATVATPSLAQVPISERTKSGDRADCLTVGRLRSAVNQLDATLEVNFNSAGGYPLKAIAGAMDPTIITVAGQPGAAYAVHAIACGRSMATDPPFASGLLDDGGRAMIMIPPNTFRTNSLFTLQAVVEDLISPGDVAFSGASVVKVVGTMSSNVTLGMPTGSIADIRGPVTMLGDGTVFVGNLPFNVTAETEYSNLTDIAELAPGDWLVIDGAFNAAGGFNARQINLEDTEPLARLSGRVQGIGPSGLVLLGVSVYVNSATTYVDDATGAGRSLADIEPGMPISVRIPAGTEFPHVVQVNLDIPIELEPEPEPEPEDENEDPPPAPPFCS